MRRAATAALVTAVGLAGCGGDSGDNKAPDAGPDASLGCRVVFTVNPANPVAPLTLTAQALVSGQIGVYTIDWRITGPAGDVTETPLDSSGARVSFPASVAGPYQVTAAIQGSRSCLVTPVTINVSAPGARTVDVRLRYTPLPGQGAPPQVDPKPVQVLGGADLALAAPRILDAGTVARAQVLGPAGGLAAYLRLESASAGRVELYADPAGAFDARVPFGTYEALVVPYGAGVPPKIYPSITPGMLGMGVILDAGDALSGTVRAAGGMAVTGARVAIANGALPPTVVVTDASGAFAARARLGYGALKLTVVPPAPYARHESVLAQVPAAGSTLDVELADVELVPIPWLMRDSSGAVAPGARATFISGPISPGGTLSVNGGTPLPGLAWVRASVVAGADGLLPELRLPRARYTVIVEPPAGSGDVPVKRSFDMTSDPPPEAPATAAPATSIITVKDAASAAVAGARVVAVAGGVSGAAAGAAVAAVTGGDGRASLLLAPGLPYALTVDAPAGRRLGRARAALAGGAPLGVTLPAALVLTGSLVFPSGSGQPGVRVEALCAACDDPLPLAETVTEAGGRFSLLVPDPGLGSGP